MSDSKEILVRILRCDTLFSDSELKRATALLLKEHGVPNRVIRDIVRVSVPTLQGWWRDWQADSSVAAVIDRRKGYSLCLQDQEKLRACIKDVDNRGRLSVHFVSEQCAVKMSGVEVMLKLLLQPLPQVLESDRRARRASSSISAEQYSKYQARSKALAPERQKVFDDALDFIQQLESGGVHSSRQQLFDTALDFLEDRERGGKAVAPANSSTGADKQNVSSMGGTSGAQESSAMSKVNIDDVLSFIESREQDRHQA